MRQPVAGDERIMATLRVELPRQVKTVLHSLSVYPKLVLGAPCGWRGGSLFSY